MSVSAQGYSVGYNFASRNQKSKKSRVFSRVRKVWVSAWGKSRRRTSNGYLTNFATPSSKRVRGR